VQNTCSTYSTTYKQNFQFKNTPDGAVNASTLHILVIQRSVFSAIEGSTLWGHNGPLTVREVQYACGSQVSTCSDSFTHQPQAQFTETENPCGQHCAYEQARNATSGELMTLEGDPSCTDAVPPGGAICSSQPTLSRLAAQGVKTRVNQFSKVTSDSNVGVCIVSDITFTIDGNKNPDQGSKLGQR